MDKVIRPFIADIPRVRGEVLDLEPYKHGSKLRSLRYTEVFIGRPVKCKHCKRMFAGKEEYLRHLGEDHGLEAIAEEGAEDKEG